MCQHSLHYMTRNKIIAQYEMKLIHAHSCACKQVNNVHEANNMRKDDMSRLFLTFIDSVPLFNFASAYWTFS